MRNATSESPGRDFVRWVRIGFLFGLALDAFMLAVAFARCFAH